MKQIGFKIARRAAVFSVLALLALGAVTMRYAIYAPDALRQLFAVLGG